MKEEIELSEEDKASMDRLSITCSPSLVYFFKQHRYDKLSDAVRYAEGDYASMRNQKK